MSFLGTGMIAKNNALTYWDAAVSAALSIDIMTFGGDFVFAGIVSLSMILIGVVFSRVFNYTTQKEGQLEPPLEEVGNVGLFAIVALGAFIIFTWVLNLIYYTPASQSLTISTWFGLFSFDLSQAWSGTYTAGFIFIGLVIPMAEEQFFRGLLGNGATRFLGPILGVGAAGAVFAGFHIGVDGLNTLILTTIALDGATIMALDLATGQLLTGILAHRANNILTFFVRGSVIGFLGVAPFHFPTQAIVPLGILGLLVVQYARNRPHYIARVRSRRIGGMLA